MGQYHTIYNVDKKEYYSFGGAKLWEKAANNIASMGLHVLLANSNGRGGGDLSNPIMEPYPKALQDKPIDKAYRFWSNDKQKYVRTSKAKYTTVENALAKVSGRWSGDRIVIQGDYAEKTDTHFLTEKQQAGFKNITPLVIAAFEAVLKVPDIEENNELLKSIEFEKQYM